MTPRMKPYLYGLSVLMVIWAASEGRYLLAPQYKAKLARSFVLILPALMLSVHLPAPGESSMAKSYDNAGPFMAAGNGGRVNGEKKTPAPLPDITITETEEDTETAADRQEEEKSQGQGLSGLDAENRTITVADEDYYAWMYELGTSYETYKGYTVILKGFIYKDAEIEKEADFALVRLSMWCCAADLSPVGCLVDCGRSMDFKEDDWVVVKGTVGLTADGASLMLKAQSIEAAEKPEEEYIYPSF